MKKAPAITSIDNKTGFRKKLVEKFVQQNLPPVSIRESRISGMGGFSSRYSEIECCAAETPVEGNIEIYFAPKILSRLHKINVSVNSRFFVFFKRDNKQDFQVA